MTQHPETISVVGAGIMGIMCAYTLQQKFPDCAVTLYDPDGFPANNASFMAGGMISPFSELDHMPNHFLPAGLSAIDIWESISKDTGSNFEFSRNGSLLISHDKDRHILERFKSILPACDDWEVANANRIKTLEPALPNNTFRNGVNINREAHLHPQKTMITLLNNIQNKASKALDLKQKSYKTNTIIDCRGIGAKTNDQELRGVKGETLVVRNTEFHLSRPLRLMHPRYPLYIVPREDNIFMIGATIIESENNESVSIRSGMELMSALYSIHPSFGDADILEMNAGIRPAYPDNLPRVTMDGNIIRCNGLYRHGFLFAPIMAECTASIIAGEDYEFNALFVRNNDNENYIERTAVNA